jgi:3'(2'), 5'-bisphosphate nucleotidase
LIPLGPSELESLRQPVLDLVREAGRAILAIYQRDFEITRKEDRSPLTEADLAAHRILVAGLAALEPRAPVLSEESAPLDIDARRQWRRLWLVDPLDGTREFIKRNGEFTVNVALVEDGVSVLGVVHAPALDETASAVRGGPLRVERGGAVVMPAAPNPARPRVAASRSHGCSRSGDALARLGDHELLAVGSALKFIRVASGEADVYLRLGPTSEWDTAAGQCLVEAAGGSLVSIGGEPFRYNARDSLLNGDFIAAADSAVDWIARFGLRKSP